MKFFITLIFSLVMFTFAAEKEFKTFALCTTVKGIDYCAVNSSNVKFVSDSIKYTLISSNQEVYTYNVKPLTTKVEFPKSKAKVNYVAESINNNGNKGYLSLETEHTFILVDDLTSCYIKKYYTGTINYFYESFKFINIDINDFFGFYMQCLDELKENN